MKSISRSLAYAGKEIRNKKNIYCLKHGDDFLSSENDLKSIIESFYTNLFDYKKIDPDKLNSLLGSLNTNENIRPLQYNLNFSTDQVIQIINKLPNNKSPGPDGFTYSIYKELKEIIAEPLCDVFNQIVESGHCPENFNLSNTILIYKNKGSDKDIKNYRPIALLNSDYKIFMHLIKDSLYPFAEKIISPDQFGFMNNKQIFDPIIFIKLLLDKYKLSNSDKQIIFVDQKKAYDMLNRDFIYKVLEKMNIPKILINIIKSTQVNSRTKVLFNSTSTNEIKVLSGVPQGCPLSPLLYILTFQTLTDHYSKHLSAGIDDQRILKFADNTLFLVNNDLEKQDVFNCLDDYCKASGSQLNEDETQIIHLSLNKDPVNNRVKYLGNLIGHSVNEDDIWSPILDKCQSIIARYSTVHLNHKMKINVIKSMVMSKLLFILQTNTLSKPYIDRFERICWKFLNNNGNGLVRKDIAYLPFNLNGLNFPNLLLIKHTLLSKQVVRLLNENVIWSHLVIDFITKDTKINNWMQVLFDKNVSISFLKNKSLLIYSYISSWRFVFHSDKDFVHINSSAITELPLNLFLKTENKINNSTCISDVISSDNTLFDSKSVSSIVGLKRKLSENAIETTNKKIKYLIDNSNIFSNINFINNKFHVSGFSCKSIYKKLLFKKFNCEYQFSFNWLNIFPLVDFTRYDLSKVSKYAPAGLFTLRFKLIHYRLKVGKPLKYIMSKSLDPSLDDVHRNAILESFTRCKLCGLPNSQEHMFMDCNVIKFIWKEAETVLSKVKNMHHFQNIRCSIDDNEKLFGQVPYKVKQKNKHKYRIKIIREIIIDSMQYAIYSNLCQLHNSINKNDILFTFTKYMTSALEQIKYRIEIKDLNSLLCFCSFRSSKVLVSRSLQVLEEAIKVEKKRRLSEKKACVKKRKIYLKIRIPRIVAIVSEPVHSLNNHSVCDEHSTECPDSRDSNSVFRVH